MRYPVHGAANRNADFTRWVSPLHGGACHPRRVASEQTTAFVLGGGGILGAAEVGMLRALLEREIVPDLIVGSSVGALNGAFIAADPSWRPSRVWSICGPASPTGGCSADRCSDNSARWPGMGRISTPTMGYGDCSTRGSARARALSTSASGSNAWPPLSNGPAAHWFSPGR